MSELTELAALCKAGLFIEVNDHRNNYQSIDDALKQWDVLGFGDDIPEDLRKEMIARDTIVHIKAYTRTPVGFYSVFHFDIDQAVHEALESVRHETREER